MRNIIKKILRESTETPKRVFRYIDSIVEHFEWDIDSIMEDLEQNLNLSKVDAYTLLFEYYISKGDDPTKDIDFQDITYYVYTEDLLKILNNSGWLDKYLKNKDSFPRDFRDIEEIGDGERFILKLDDWEEFKCLFDDDNLAQRVLNSDWAELYGWFDVDFSDDIVDILNKDTIKHIQEYVKEKGLIGKELENSDGEVLTEEMVNDEGILLELIGEDELFYDLKDLLEDAYRVSYDSAAEDEIFKILEGHITSFFGNKPEWVDGNKLHIDVTTIFYDFLVRYLTNKGEMPSFSQSYFLDVICETLEEEDGKLITPDMGYFYPDSDLVAEHLSDYIKSNI
jgi:hypothetical protein